MTYRYLCWLGSLLLVIPHASWAQITNFTLVPAGSTWKYLDTGTYLQPTWRSTTFDDTDWASGPAQLGYGDGDERTVVSFGLDPNFKHITTYFRHAFILDDASGIAAMTVRLLRDDGGVVYLNGVEIFRSNMPSGYIDYYTFALGTIPNEEESAFFAASVDPALLSDGTNVLAVEIHQATYASSDISFDLSLGATALVGPPSIIAQPQPQTSAPGGTATFRVRASGTPPLSFQWDFNGAAIPDATNATLHLSGLTLEHQGLYRVRITNAFGTTFSDKVALTVVALTGEFFQVTSLAASNALAVEHLGVTGNDRGGIAVSFNNLLLTGDDSTARFNLADLSGATSLATIHNALVSDLRSGALYVLASDSTPLSGNGTVNTLLELDGVTGALTGNAISLSAAIDVNGCYGCIGIFAGFGCIVLHNGNRVFTIRLPSGEVIDHGPMNEPAHVYSENWAYWGVAEYFEGTPWIVYVADYQNIRRSRVPDGLTLPVAAFENLADMASITVSPLLDRWYFHHQGESQFRSGNETVGFAEARLAHEQHPQPPAVLVPPRDRRVPPGGDAIFTVMALGYPLSYQWRFNGQDIANATNQTLSLEGVTAAQVGLYSAVVSNALGSVVSSPALLDVVSGSGNVSAVAVLAAEGNGPWNEDVRQKIEATGLFNQVDVFQVTFGFPVPTLEQLQAYDAVLVYSDEGFNDGVAMGNVLADYVDDGGGLVVATFAFSGVLQGRIVTGDYLPFTLAGQDAPGGLTLVAEDPGHPILAGIGSFNGGYSSYHNRPLNLTSEASLVARWSNGQPLVGTKASSGIQVVGLNFFPPSSDGRNDFWDARTDGAQLLGNALLWAGGGGGETVPLVPPGIRTEPADATVLLGLDAQFSVRAYGSPPLAYQWYFNGLPLTDATNKALTLRNVQTDQSGGYHAVISNAFGMITSQVATLIVQPTRGVVGYYTEFETFSKVLESPIARAGYTPLHILNPGTADLTRLHLLMINLSSDPPSADLRNRLPAIREWVDQGGRLIVHQSYLYTTEALTANPLLLGVRGVSFEPYYGTDINLIPPTSNLVATGPHGTLTDASLDSTDVSYSAFAQRATLPPRSVAFFSTGFDSSQVLGFAYGLGEGLVYYSTIPLKDHLEYSSAPAASVMREVYAPNVLEYAAAYRPAGPPVILTPPQPLLVTEGTPATLFVSAGGQAPLQYQWRFNGVPMAGATNNPLRLASVATEDAGAYSVVVSNQFGSVTSAAAALTVVPRLSVAVFSNPRYVYEGGDSPSANVRATLLQQGHGVDPVVSLLAAVTNDVLLFPDLGIRPLAGDLDEASRTLLQAYVAQGGLLIVQGGYSGVDLLNLVFGLALSPDGCYTDIDFSRTAQSAGTLFAAAPPSLPANYCTYTLVPGSWPENSLSLYANEFYGSVVTLIPFGAGALLHLGWDWNDAAPYGNQDGGWSKVLACAVQARGLVTPPALVSVPLVPAGSVWRFLDDGSNQSSAWRSLVFNDGSWASGPAQLGYGDGDEATVLSFGADPNNKHITTYFRHAFVLTNAAAVSHLNLRLLRDDGAAVYLNGMEILRDCLPDPADFATYAFCTISDVDENVFLSYAVDPRLLRNGTNVLAVEIHQVNPTSSDISFDLALTGGIPAGAPVIVTPPTGRSVLAGSTVSLEVVASGALPMSYQWRYQDQDLSNATNAILILGGLTTNQAGSYSVIVSNAFGSVASSGAVVTVLTLGEDIFRIGRLSSGGAAVIDNRPFEGGDRDGIAASDATLFYPRNSGTIRYALTDLSGGTNFGKSYYTLVSDLKTETVYALATGTNVLTWLGGVATTLLELDGATGEPTGLSRALSQPIDLRNPYGQVGLFAGLGRVVVHDGARAWSIALPSGQVVELGEVNLLNEAAPWNPVYGGVAESFGGSIWLVFARNSRDIVRVRTSDGFTETVGTFDNLGNMGSLTVSLPYNRWYFHHRGYSQFSRFEDTIGYADAAFEVSTPPMAPAIVKPPEDHTVAAGGAVVLRPAVRGTGPLHYQWLFEGSPLLAATNSTLVLSPIQPEQAGLYSVLVSNQVGSVVSPNALVTVVALAGDTFRITSLTTNNPVIVDHDFLTGGARAGIAVSARQAFYSGNSSAARFDMVDLSGGTPLGRIYDGLIGDLASETVYVLANGTNLFSDTERLVTHLLELDGQTGEWSGARVALSQPIDLRNRFQVGLFAGLGRIVVADGAQIWTIEMPAGQVLALGPMTVPEHVTAGVGAYWGVAEYSEGAIWLVYVRDSQTIVRTRVPDGATSILAGFNYLSDMPAITVSLPFNRWYFHHQYSSQFGGSYQTLGFADAGFVSSKPPLAPSIVRPPADQKIAVSGTASFGVVARGTGPLFYQWLFEGTALPGATNSVLVLSNITSNQAGRYSVVVSNAAQTVTSVEAQLQVVPSVAVALFDDPQYVYTWGNQYAHSDSVQASLRRLGHQPIPFTSIINAASGTAPILFPALEAGDLAPDLSPAAREALRSFVVRGGLMIVSGVNNDMNRPTRLLNAVFGYTVQGVYSGSALFRTTLANGTAFAEAPEFLPYNEFSQGLRTSSLPQAAAAIYESNDSAGVVLFHYGSGKIIFLGWNWNDAVPLGRQDGGWLKVLAGAVEEAGLLHEEAPQILEQPRNAVTLAGQTVQFQVVAMGYPLAYQWLLGGAPLAGATNDVLVLNNVTGDQAGLYAVVVSNRLGSVTSAEATLTIVAPLFIGVFDDPRFVDTSGGPQASADNLQATLAQFGHRVRPFTSIPAAVTNQVLVFPPFVFGNPTPNLDGASRSALQSFVRQGGLIIVHGAYANVEFLNSLFDLFLTYYGYYGGEYHRTSEAVGTLFAGGPPVLPYNYATFSLWAASFPLLGSRTLYGQNDLSALALIPYGAGNIIFMGWDWFDAAPVGGQDNGWVEALSHAVLTGVASAPTPPHLSLHPQGQTKLAGEDVSFTVRGFGSTPLHPQWFFNAQPLPGATNATLTLVSVQTNQAGDYSVVVSNSYGAVTSQVATLFVQPVRGIAGYYGDNAPVSFALAGAIRNASFTPLPINDLSEFDLSQLDLLLIEEWDSVNPSSDLLGRIADLEGWVDNGGKLILHDWLSTGASAKPRPTLLAAPSALPIYNPGEDIDIIPPGNNLLVAGPHGTLDNGSLDGGYYSCHGYVFAATLPPRALPILGAGSDPNQVAAFSYALGAGSIYYAALPLSHLLDQNSAVGASFREVYLRNLLEQALVFSVTGPPVFLVEPDSRGVVPHGEVELKVRVNGQIPLSYQWYFNGNPLPQATSSAWVLSDVTLEQAGNYQVVVSNALGSATSAVATVSLLQATPFRIIALNSQTNQIVDHTGITGSDWGGIGLSSTHVYYTGASASGRFSAADLAGGIALAQRYEALVGDLSTETLYTLATDTGLVSGPGDPVTAFIEIDGSTGDLTGNRIPLSRPIPLGSETGLFASYEAAVLHTGGRAYRIELPSGQVQDLGAMNSFAHAACVNWAYWGVAEFFGGAVYLDYVRDSQTIARTRVPDGLTTSLATFVDLGNMCCFTVSVPRNRWYFHYQGAAEFGGTGETLGYAAAFIDRPPQVATIFSNRVIDEDTSLGNILFSLADEESFDQLRITGRSSDPVLLPDANIVISGVGRFRFLRLTPAPDQFGVCLVTIAVTDAIGLSSDRSFTLTVNPVNDAPVLLDIPDQMGQILTPLVLTNPVLDVDLPGDAFTFGLGAQAPAGAVLDANTGVFFWIPSRDQASSTNRITVVVTDNGTPPLSATNAFTVVVGDFLELSLGSTLLQPGQTGSVDVTSHSSVGVTNLSLLLQISEAESLRNLALQTPAPELLEAAVSPLAPGQFVATLRTLENQPILGTKRLASLAFMADAEQPSSFIRLTISGVTARQVNGTPVSKILVHHGRVAIVGTAPLLEAVLDSNNQGSLVLYGNPGVQHTLESTPEFSSEAVWQMEWQGELTNLFQVFNLNNTNRAVFFRARR